MSLGIIRGARPGTVNIRGLNNALTHSPATGMISEASGDGFVGTTGHCYIRAGIVGNVTVDTRDIRSWSFGESVTDGTFRIPIALNFFLQNLAIEAQGSIAFAIGKVPNVAPPHTAWRTDATIRRMMLLVERNAGGVITYFLVACDGAAVSQITVPAIPLLTWVSLLYKSVERRFELYVAGNLHGALVGTLPAVNSATQFPASVGVWKTITGAARNEFRIHGIGVAHGLDVAV